MTVSPEQFQRRVRVRLPIADRYLAGGDEAAAAERDLERAFARPILRVTIAPAGKGATGADGPPSSSMPSPSRFMSAAGPDDAPSTGPVTSGNPASPGAAGPRRQV